MATGRDDGGGTAPASVRVHRWRGVAAVTLTSGELQATFVPRAGFACLEPMTASTNALVAGDYPVVAPGESFTARFSIRPERIQPGTT
jgi:galactose mutarotase-like enzyme